MWGRGLPAFLLWSATACPADNTSQVQGCRSEAGGALSVGLCLCSPRLPPLQQGSPWSRVGCTGWLCRFLTGSCPGQGARGVGWKPELSRALPSATRHGWGATPGRRRGVESIWRVRPGWLTQGTPSLLHTRGSSHTAVLIPWAGSAPGPRSGSGPGSSALRPTSSTQRLPGRG